jgi:hypothetical protein
MKVSVQKSFNESDRQHLTEIFGKMDLLIRDVVPMIENCNRLDSQRLAMLTKITEARTKSEQIKELSNNSAKLLEGLHQILVTMQQIIDEIKSKSMKGLNLMSPDGTYIDKVNFSVLINDKQAITSGSIYTSNSGYAMELIYEIYTDGHKQKHYLSISVVLLMGDFDAILSWPMSYPMKISIVDLTPAKKDIVHSIPIDSRMVEFNRPVSDTNIPYRKQEFCLVDTLLEKRNNYIQDGFMFIQLHIDFTAPGVNTVPDKGLQKPMGDYINRNIVENMS